jgi:hypothetical protein
MTIANHIDTESRFCVDDHSGPTDIEHYESSRQCTEDDTRAAYREAAGTLPSAPSG